MRKKLFDTTFGKLTVAYVFLGVIPLLLLSCMNTRQIWEKVWLRY